MEEGFGDWSKRDFRALVTACERHGRTAKESIIAEVAEITEKPLDNVVKYYETFMARQAELPDWDKLNEKISKGEQKIKRREAMEIIIAEKVGKTVDPFRSLSIPYQLQTARAGSSNRGFTEDEDRFLVCMLNVLGYGAWESLRSEIRRSEQFRFNWFIKSRSSEDLHRRSDALVRLLEREAGEFGLVSDEVLGRKRARPRVEAGAAAGKENAGRKRKRVSMADATTEVVGAADESDSEVEEVGASSSTKARAAPASR
jgi:SWI/SNF-related matrix-associated actin-dependent regulator of chromatin subfamily A member 5